MSRRKPWLILLPVALAVGISLLAIKGPPKSVVNNALIGRSEASIRWTYGAPETDWEEYQPLALRYPPERPSGRIRTLIFRPGGLLHPERGTVWVWVTERNGEWMCFESCWFADNVRF